MSKHRLTDEVETVRTLIHGSASFEPASESLTGVEKDAFPPAVVGFGFGSYLIGVSHRKSSGLNFGRLSKSETPVEF